MNVHKTYLSCLKLPRRTVCFHWQSCCKAHFHLITFDVIKTNTNHIITNAKHVRSARIIIEIAIAFLMIIDSDACTEN